MVNELSNFGQGFYPPACIYSYQGMMGKILDPTLNIHISCYITDTVEGCKPMNSGHLWICLVGITPSNNPGTEREFLSIALYGHGQPHWSSITIPEQGNTV